MADHSEAATAQTRPPARARAHPNTRTPCNEVRAEIKVIFTANKKKSLSLSAAVTQRIKQHTMTLAQLQSCVSKENSGFEIKDQCR